MWGFFSSSVSSILSLSVSFLCVVSSLLLKWAFELRLTMPSCYFFIIRILFKRSSGDKTCPPIIDSSEGEPSIEHAEEEEQDDKKEECKVSENSLPVDLSLPTDIGNVSLSETTESAEVEENEESSENGASETTGEGNLDVPQELGDSRSPQGIILGICSGIAFW